MSWNRESAAWQSKDKTWSIGFYPGTSYNTDSDDYDEEWDVNYDYDRFEWVSTGHPTVEAATRAGGQRYGNFGGPTIYRWNKENAEEIAKFEQMALWHTNPAQAEANQKKQEAKLNREHAKKLKEEFIENNDYKGRKVTVIIKRDSKAHTTLGMSTSFTGYLRQEGDWLVIDKVKVKNVVTGRLNGKLHDIRVEREAWSYSGNWYR